MVSTMRTDRPIDVLASLLRGALTEHSVEALELNGAELALLVEIAERGAIVREGDEGPQPNPLWARWIARTRAAQIERVRERLEELERSHAEQEGSS